MDPGVVFVPPAPRKIDLKHDPLTAAVPETFLMFFTKILKKGSLESGALVPFRLLCFRIVQRIAFYFLANRPIHPSIFLFFTENENNASKNTEMIDESSSDLK